MGQPYFTGYQGILACSQAYSMLRGSYFLRIGSEVGVNLTRQLCFRWDYSLQICNVNMRIAITNRCNIDKMSVYKTVLYVCMYVLMLAFLIKKFKIQTSPSFIVCFPDR